MAGRGGMASADTRSPNSPARWRVRHHAAGLHLDHDVGAGGLRPGNLIDAHGFTDRVQTCGAHGLSHDFLLDDL